MTSNYRDNLEVLFTKQEIEAVVARLADEITREYRDWHPLLAGVLKGSFIFMSDLARRLDFPLEIGFVQLASYGKGIESTGKIKLAQALKTPVSDRNVIVVEDIMDTGQTLVFLMDYLKKKKPASLRLCCLLDKPSRRKFSVPVDYRGFTVPDKFIVGYGMDYAEQYRNLPDICTFEE